MIAAPGPGALLLKEARALAPIWLAAAIVVAASAAAGLVTAGLFAFALGSVALGAFSIGHEYAHRTLPVLLAQPIARSRVLLAKLLVLAPLLVLLGAIVALTLLQTDAASRTLGGDAVRWRWAIVVLTPALGLCVAPWLTMACRSPMAGMVFTLAVPAALWIAGQIARAAASGFATRPLEYTPGVTLMFAGVLLLAALGTVAGGMTFLRLEAADAPGERVRLRAPSGPAIAAATPAARRRPSVRLVTKELRLQALVFVVAALYTAGWIGMRAAQMQLYIAGQSFEALAGLYSVFAALLAGALASAEERALGTREWQLLAPYPFRKQWAIKTAVAVALALLLGPGLATALEWLLPLAGDSRTGLALVRVPGLYLGDLLGLGGETVVVTVLVAALGLFVSSLCSGGLRALVLVLPVSMLLYWLYVEVSITSGRATRALVEALAAGPGSPSPFWWSGLATAGREDFRWANAASEWLALAAAAAFTAMLLVYAYRNHRTMEPRYSSALRQLVHAGAFVLAATVVLRALPQFLRWFLLTH